MHARRTGRRFCFLYQGKQLEVSLNVCGAIEVHFNGEKYKYASDFPETLKERIKKYPNSWNILQDDEPFHEELDIFIDSNNWFEYLFEGDGELFEDDLSKATPERILKDMTKIARQYFGLIE